MPEAEETREPPVSKDDRMKCLSYHQCSEGDICDPCLKDLQSSRTYTTPQSMICVRPGFCELNIFHQGDYYRPHPRRTLLICIVDSDLKNRFQDSSAQKLIEYHLKDNPVPSDWSDLFEVRFSWELDELPQRLVDWMSNGPPIISSMAVLNSTQFRKLVSRHAEEIRRDLKVFLSLGFLLRAKRQFPEYPENSDFDRDLLLSVRNFAGSVVLSWLDRRLRSFRVDGRSKEEEEWQILFLILLCTMLAICFATDKVLLINSPKYKPSSA